MVASLSPVTSTSGRIIDRIFTPGLAQVAYLVADERAGVAVVIDPRRDVDVYLEWADRHGVKLIGTLETHVHADFVSGARELLERAGVPVYASRIGETEFPHQPLDDEDEIAVGSLRLRAFWTPGHTPEHMSYLLFEPGRDEPIALFSGDALFVGEVGRPDLLGEQRTTTLVEHLYDTVFDRLTALPDDVVVYPGHTAGSSCGRSIGDAPSTTIGQERTFSYAFKPRIRKEFAAAIMENMPRPPAYYPTMKVVNKVGPTLLQTLSSGKRLDPAALRSALQTGALLIDTRDVSAFNRGHIPGSFFAGLGVDFVNWIGWLAPYDRDLVLIADDDAAFETAKLELHRIGLDRIFGIYADGMDAWAATGGQLQTNRAATPREIAGDVVTGAVSLLDVRSLAEWNMGHVAGAIHQVAGDLVRGAESKAPAGRPVAVVCASGYRSTVITSVLQARGVENVINVSGGMDAWYDAGLPVVTD